MRLEDLAEFSGDELEKITQDELNRLCAPFINLTRPELVTRAPSTHRQTTAELSFEMKQKIKILAENGIDASYLSKFKKR